jgi:hypothetical protein
MKAKKLNLTIEKLAKIGCTLKFGPLHLTSMSAFLKILRFD